MQEERRTETTHVEDEAAELAAKAARLRKIMLAAAIVLGIGLGLLLTRCSPREAPEKLFEAEQYRITLASRFQETGDRSGYDRAYKSNRESVYVSVVSFDGDEALSGLSAAEFAEKQAARNGGSELKTEAGVPYFEAEYESGGTRYACLEAAYKAEDCFLLVNFVCKASRFEDCRPEFLRFAASVETK